MPQVDIWDYANRRYYLSLETVTGGIDFAAAYLEERAYRQASGEDIRGQRPMLLGQGFVAKGGSNFTERYVLHLDGARPVPYDTSHTLVMLVEPITQESNPDNNLSGEAVFDRTPLSSGIEVNIDVGYRQVEVITVNTQGGSGDANLANQNIIISLINEIRGAGFSTTTDSLAVLEERIQTVLTNLSSIEDVIELFGYTTGKPLTRVTIGNTTTLTVGTKVVTIVDTNDTTTTITRTS